MVKLNQISLIEKENKPISKLSALVPNKPYKIKAAKVTKG